MFNYRNYAIQGEEYGINFLLTQEQRDCRNGCMGARNLLLDYIKLQREMLVMEHIHKTLIKFGG
jgi:hypothetical protein